MAKISQIVEVCDECRSMDRPVKHYRIAPEGGRLRKVVLCDEHGAPLMDLVTRLNLWSRSRSSRQVTMEEIEKVKAKQKRS